MFLMAVRDIIKAWNLCHLCNNLQAFIIVISLENLFCSFLLLRFYMQNF